MAVLSSLNTGLNSNLSPLGCLPLGTGSGFSRPGRGVGFGMKEGTAEEEPFSPLAPLLVCCFLRSWFLLSSKCTATLASSPRERGKNLLQLVSEKDPAGTAQEQGVLRVLAPPVLPPSSPCCAHWPFMRGPACWKAGWSSRPQAERPPRLP